MPCRYPLRRRRSELVSTPSEPYFLHSFLTRDSSVKFAVVVVSDLHTPDPTAIVSQLNACVFRERLGPDNRLEESVVSWKQLYQQHEPLPLNVDRLRCIDTDSGTYSGEDEDDMVATSDGGSSTDQQIVES